MSAPLAYLETYARGLGLTVAVSQSRAYSLYQIQGATWTHDVGTLAEALAFLNGFERGLVQPTVA